MRSESGLTFLPLARVGTVRVGLAPAWLPAQAIGLVGFGILACTTLARSPGEGLDLIGGLRVALVLLAAVDLTILVHEAGHALAAHAAGVTVRAIVLMAYGGATIRAATTDPRVARWTAAGGPLANLLAAAFCAVALCALDPHCVLAIVLIITGAFQAINALANLLPFAFLDGAHIFSPAHRS